ncbi:MAG TPA: CoA transferase [Microvirga sp.]|jgi:crotonobetainyl-CoA:carnitine CoA-transferase CaiB-like acyl-CoA transferase|nr:CoA transferase [Microvirga sp.]
MRPLSGSRVVDFGQGVAGPYCSMLLGDFGADIIKVEPMRGDWSRAMGTLVSEHESTTYLSVNRNKRSICLDMTKVEAREVAAELVGQSDVVVESFRPGVMQRMGLDYERLSCSDPRLIYCSITGFGSDGPYAQLPAGDSTIQALGGLMSIVGEPDRGPVRVGNVVSDMLAGMHGFEAVLLAMLERQATGRGRKCEISLLDTLLAFQAPPLVEYLATEQLPQRSGGSHPLIAPSGVLLTTDRPITFTVLAHQWASFCEFLGEPQLEADPRFVTNETRAANRSALMNLIQAKSSGRSSAELLHAMREADILCAPVNSYQDVAEDMHVQHTGLLRQVQHPTLGVIPFVANPIRFKGQEAEIAPPPMLGEQTRSILADVLRKSGDEIEALAAVGAINPPP